MTTKEDFLTEVADLVSIVRIYRHDEDRVDTLQDLRYTLNRWLTLNCLPLFAAVVRFDETSRNVVAEMKGYCGQRDKDEYLAALQELLEGHIEVQEWKPNFDSAGRDTASIPSFVLTR